MKSTQFIAHRGYAKHYPENTRIAVEAALDAGARYVEIDIQFTGDGVPVLLHDANLKRTTGTNKKIISMEWPKVNEILVNEAKSHPKKFAGVGIPALSEIVELFQSRPEAQLFVEIKQESIDEFGIEKVVRTLSDVCRPIIERCILIGYDALALRCSRAMGFKRIGYILKKYDDEHLSMVTELTPDFLFCNHTKLPTGDEPLWRGPWTWAIYEVDKVKLALNLIGRDIRFIETMAIGELLKSKQLQSRSAIAEAAV